MLTLPPLPEGFAWRPRIAGGGELTIWGVTPVAEVYRIDAGWLSRVNVCFHPSLHKEGLAGSKRQACYWAQRWVQVKADAIYRARPRSCSMLGRPAGE